MAMLIILFFVLAIFHFVYESLIAPSLRTWVKYQLFALRDELRLLEVKHATLIDDEIYDYLQASLNNTIRFLPRINFSLARLASAETENIKAYIRKRNELIEQCSLDEIRAIRDRHLDLVGYALLVNTGAWFFYLVPIALCLFTFDRMRAAAQAVLYMPESEADRILGPRAVVAAAGVNVRFN